MARNAGNSLTAKTVADPVSGLTPFRAALYMAALVASRHNPVIAEFYQRLRDNGKKPKVAIVACMRKMLVMLNAMMRDGTEWRGAAKSA